ncbi:MAG: ATP-binding protein, partial [Holophagales bacterium]|nr:ATP-binding protein [Holophagales bacterium]
ARWWREQPVPRLDLRSLAVLALLASITASAAWHTFDRQALRTALARSYLPHLDPPTGEELNTLLLRFDHAFATLGPDSILPRPQSPAADPRDLAFALWRHSPLSRYDGLSALLVRTRDGRRSSFAFGLAVDARGVPLPDPARWPVPASASWRDGLIEGESLLGHRAGEPAGPEDSSTAVEPWGSVRYWFLPRPGFRIAVDEREELERNLVRGKPRQETADGLPRDARYGLFDLDGRALSSPWDESPPLPAAYLPGATSTWPEERGRAAEARDAETGAGRILGSWTPGRQIRTPDGPAWFWSDSGIDGIEALFLPVLGPRTALERAGFDVVVLLLALLLLAGVGWVSSAPPMELGRRLQAAVRSYSRRLILVYTILLLLPLIALNLVLLRSFSERLARDQLRQAQSAMFSARQLLLDYLQGLEPGFLIETQVNRELLEWIGGLVQHQVNLYWGSRLYASSQQELFTAGLLPERIPAEVYTRLTLLGYDMAFRRQRTGELAYLEVYAPFDAPGIVSSQQGLFLSVPLLEQEEEAARQLALLRRRALLFTTALFLLLLAVGRRLTRGFTRPIVELIEGTRRIARGETFGVDEPRETELQALTSAISAMADQVQESRRTLTREKHFVERVVANITSAVVSIDHGRRVAFQNAVAAERLGTRAGIPIVETLAADASLQPIAEFLESVADSEQPRSTQVKLKPSGEKVEVLEWTLTWVPIPGTEDPAALLVVDDATEVLRGQRLEAWAEMARIIAHEIKNPLTPIQLSAEHLRQVWNSDRDRLEEVVDRCTSNILSNVEELRSIASEFSIYSRIPAIELVRGNLAPPLRELVAGYEHAAETTMSFVAEQEEIPVRFDAKLFGRAMRNLLENALRAAGDGGRVEVRLEHDGEVARVQVIDSGPGVDPRKLSRIFEPYFSTYESGTGLGLAITRRIVDEHGGAIEARNRPGGGLCVLITIPLSEIDSRAT